MSSTPRGLSENVSSADQLADVGPSLNDEVLALDKSSSSRLGLIIHPPCPVWFEGRVTVTVDVLGVDDVLTVNVDLEALSPKKDWSEVELSLIHI